MKAKTPRITPLLYLTLGLAACSSENRTRTPTTQVNLIHAAQSFGSLDFLRVQRREQTLDFAESGVFAWDSDTYTFNIDARRPSSTEVDRVHSFTATLAAGNDHIIVLGEVSGEIQELVIAVERVTPSSGETEVTLVHTASTLGPVDIYLEAPGTNLAAATPRGTLAFRASSPPFNVTEASYEVTLTEVGNPANVLLASRDFGLSGGQRTVIALLDGANVGIAPYAVLVSAGGNDFSLVDRTLQAGIRALNAMTSGAPLDVTVDSNFSPPLLPAVPAGIPSAYAFIDAGDRNLTVSPEGNPGVLEIDEPFVAASGQLGTWFISGDPGSLTASFSEDDGRIVTGQASVAVHNGVTFVTAVDVYVVPPGTDLGTVAPSATLTEGASLSGLSIEVGDIEITVRAAATTTVLAGALAATIAAEGNYGILLTDGTGGGVDITLLDDFN